VRTELAYGSDGLHVEVPDDATVIVSAHAPPLEHASRALRAALREPIGSPPLRSLVRPGQRVAISVCDITRAQPRQPMLEAIFSELAGIVAPEQATVIVATGTHRSNTPEELRTMLGELADRCRVLNHDSRDAAAMADLGVMGDGVPVRLNREWVEADVRITTGFVEPHFFAGFSGGPKMVAPGLAALETVLVLHDAARIGHPKATWGCIEGNPLQRDFRAIARHERARPHFSMDVLLDRRQRITRVFAGELSQMHARACDEARRIAMQSVAAPFDVVLTTNSGYPLDQNLYQAVKGMSAAAQVVKQGGTILCAAECRDGLPDHGRYAETLRGAESLEQLLLEIEGRETTEPDQWQVQIQALIRRRARVLVKSHGLDAVQLAAAHFEAVDDLDAAVEQALSEAGPGATLCVLPEGPQTIPYLAA
jgi:nickel-dependent lactate racemase